MGFVVIMLTIIQKIGFKNMLLIIGALLVLTMAGIDKCTNNKLKEVQAQLAKTEANLRASRDSLRFTQSNSGKNEFDKLSYIVSSLEELTKINADLAREVADTKGKVISIQKAGIRIVHDTIKVEVEKPTVINGIATIKGEYDTTYSEGNYRKLATETKYNIKDSSASQKITKDEIAFTAVTGIKSTDLGYEIFLRPNYPGMSVTSLEGAIIDKDFFKPRKNRPALITVGLQLGYIPFTYDIRAQKGGINLSQIGGGVGINFNLSRILNK